jgi:hypothetical protein
MLFLSLRLAGALCARRLRFAERDRTCARRSPRFRLARLRADRRGRAGQRGRTGAARHCRAEASGHRARGGRRGECGASFAVASTGCAS